MPKNGHVSLHRWYTRQWVQNWIWTSYTSSQPHRVTSGTHSRLNTPSPRKKRSDAVLQKPYESGFACRTEFTQTLTEIIVHPWQRIASQYRTRIMECQSVHAFGWRSTSDTHTALVPGLSAVDEFSNSSCHALSPLSHSTWQKSTIVQAKIRRWWTLPIVLQPANQRA